MNNTFSKVSNSLKPSSVLGRKKGKFNSYTEEMWFEAISKINILPTQTSGGIIFTPSQDLSVNNYVESGYITNYFE